MSVLLEAEGVSKRFGGVEALIEVSFSISRGQIFLRTSGHLWCIGKQSSVGK